MNLHGLLPLQALTPGMGLRHLLPSRLRAASYSSLRIGGILSHVPSRQTLPRHQILTHWQSIPQWVAIVSGV